MNCPNCNKKPVGLLHSFTFGGVGFKKSLEGYFKCRHCDTVLRQQKTAHTFPKYQKPFWYFFTFILAGMLGCIWGAYYVIEVYINDSNMWILIPIIIVIGLLYIFGLDHIKTRYWVIEEASLEEETPPSEQLSTTGLVAFVIFAIAAIVVFIFFDRIIDTDDLSPALYTTGSIIYVLLILGGAVFILNKFTGNEELTES